MLILSDLFRYGDFFSALHLNGCFFCVSRAVKVKDIIQVKIYLIHKLIKGIKIEDTTATIIAMAANSLERFASYSEADIE